MSYLCASGTVITMPIPIIISMLMPILPIHFRIRIGIKTMPILMRILPKNLHMLENLIFFTLSHSIVTYNVLSFSSVSEVSYVFSILDSILKFSGKKSTLSTFFICLELIPIRIGMTWVPIPIRSRQNDADPTGSGSGSTTTEFDNEPLF